VLVFKCIYLRYTRFLFVIDKDEQKLNVLMASDSTMGLYYLA